MAHYAQFCWARHCDKLSQPSHVVKKINKGKVNRLSKVCKLMMLAISGASPFKTLVKM